MPFLAPSPCYGCEQCDPEIRSAQSLNSAAEFPVLLIELLIAANSDSQGYLCVLMRFYTIPSI